MSLMNASPARRAGFLVLTLALSGAALVIPAPAGAQTEKVYRIGYLQTSTQDQGAHLVKAFEDGFRDLGYVAGRNVVIEYRFADGKLERLPRLAEELVRLKVDAIVTGINAGTAKALGLAIPPSVRLQADRIVE